MEEVHVGPVLQLLRQLLILLQNHRQILILQRIAAGLLPHYRLHRDVAEAQVRHMHDILGKVQIIVGKGAPQVVVLGPAARHQLLELGNNNLIAPLPVDRLAHAVVDLGSPVQRKDGVGHLPVDVVDVLIVQQDSVGGNRKAETLTGLFLNGACIGYCGLDGIHRHQRLAAEEVHLNIPAAAGALDDKINGPFCGLNVHDLPTGTEVASGRKTILAAQVAVVGDVEAKGLDGGGLLQGGGRRGVHIVVLHKEQPVPGQLPQVLPSLIHRLCAVFG